MRTLSAPFIAEQIKPSRTPLVKLEVASYGHPAASADTELRWNDYFWERLTAVEDATTLGLNHAVAIPADGSVCRVKTETSKVYFQRVTSPGPGSNWTAAWTNLGSIAANSLATIAAQAAEVIVFSDDGVNLYRRQSADSGATWAAWVSMANARPGERGMAAAYKANGDMAIVHASDVNDPTSLYIQIRAGGTWSAGLGQIAGDFEIIAIALYHDGDWNIIATMLDGTNVRIARAIYGDGDQYTAGTWSGWTFINSYKAAVSFTAQTRLRLWHTQGRLKSQPTYYERVSAVQEMRDADLLGVADPFLTYHASLGAVFSFARSNHPWFYRLKAGSEFKDSNWNKSWPLDTIATQGLALACDGTYLYASAPNQVWRTAIPGGWTPPTPGAGPGTNYAIPNAHVLVVKEQVEAFSPSNLIITLDNSSGGYNTLGSGAASAIGKLQLGAQVTFSLGYFIGSDLLSVAGKYFVENLAYARAPGYSHLHINCIDALGLLHRYAFNRSVEWNAGGDVTSAYDIVSLIVQAVGGSLSYVTRSAEIIATYPRLTVSPGENGAVVLRQLLSLVPDVIYFIGLTGYIVYPQAADATTYTLRFPS